MPSIGAVLFAVDQKRVARFYRDALGLRVKEEGDSHTRLCVGDFDLVVHQAHAQHLGGVRAAVERREGNPIRLDFPVGSIDAARVAAADCGGRVDDAPPGWAPAAANYVLAHDPEGNVIMLIEAERPSPRA